MNAIICTLENSKAKTNDKNNKKRKRESESAGDDRVHLINWICQDRGYSSSYTQAYIHRCLHSPDSNSNRLLSKRYMPADRYVSSPSLAKN